mmetsp:Transcript_123181/g.307586  ORF Transcript_123181/g.307586 Transcript_123181/m.307586 type:complete len:1041 (+) Transcript_123181:86-3208(+)|eukprot:CAMPEP_0115231058 /NCGR_PEP_ID=MMETSP0270-20121206/33036_1 /TAXON_ID=71861 /ORGANISM="Scrippsiella trochoidea, Strain CCMP3099" /LENGTH=1040 /DNA_ID=CAMNT_0002645671 /DNA_START=9 /DNA_END=3131 /DNA_ORIENTATION=-
MKLISPSALFCGVLLSFLGEVLQPAAAAVLRRQLLRHGEELQLRLSAAGVKWRREEQLHAGEQTPRVVVRKPKTDDRDYMHTTFSSGLRVLAVHDPSAKKTGFAVAVEAGSLEDPSDFQGLAHFCEHMLFLGTKKYPDTDEFSRTLAMYGGDHNAYTSSEETVYYNEIGNAGIEKGLDIFAQFFIAPSFAETMVDKEIHAVDSEHKKNQPDTQRRLWHLLRSRANPKSPVHQFSTGDLQTLKVQPESQGKSLEQALRTFHKEHYCANRLHLVLVSNTSIDEQLELAHRHFDALPAATAESCPPRPEYTQWPLYNNELGNLQRRITLGTQGVPELWLIFPTPPLKKRYKELAEAYIWNMLGHYGPGSLKALLLKEDLSHHYSYYVESSVAGSVMFVTLTLTEKGLAEVDLVLKYFFAYIGAIQKAGVDDELLTSVKKMRQVEFDYQEKSSSEYNLARSLAGALPSYAPEDVLTAGVLIDKPDKELIRSLLSSIVPSNMNMALLSPKFNDSTATHHEPYYNFSYAEEALEPGLLAELSNASGFGLQPPPPLAYVPESLDLVGESAGPEGPEALVGAGRVQGWWVGSGGVQLPKAVLQLKVGFPATVVERVEDAILAAIHVRIVHHILEQPTDALQTCGLYYSFAAHSDGFQVSFSGFDQHMSKMIEMVLPPVRTSGQAGKDIFEVTRRQLLLNLADITKSQPYQHAMEAFDAVTIKGSFTRSELHRAALDTQLVSPESYERFLAEVFANTRLSLLVAGNIGRDRTKQITESVAALLRVPMGTSISEQIAMEGRPQVLNPAHPLEVRMPNPIPADPNSATLVTYQFGVPSIADRVHLAMLSEFINRPVFEALRTERQLGYVVFGYAAPHGSIVEIRVIVQGFRESPDVVEALIEETVSNLTSRIEKLTADEVRARRESLRTALTKPSVSLGQVAGQHWGQIWDGTHCFNKKALQLAVLDAEENSTTSAAPLVAAWRRAVAPTSGHRKKITVKLFGAGVNRIPMSAPSSAAAADERGPITLVGSEDARAKLKGEAYWPTDFICK